MSSSELRASELRSVLAVDPPPPTVSCADIVRDGRRVVRRRRFGVALVLTAVLALLGTGTVALLPELEAEPAGITTPVTPPPASVTSSPVPVFPPLTIKDAESYSVLLAKQNWPPKGYTATADGAARPGQFQVIEDFLRMGVRLTDGKGRSGTLVITVRSPTGHPISCYTADGCRAEQLTSGKVLYSWARRSEAETAERELLVVNRKGMQVSAVVTDSVAWPILAGNQLGELAVNLSG